MIDDEIKRRALFVFIGFADEYSLAPLHRRMRARGFNCVEINEFTQNSIDALTAVRESDRIRVLLTSQRMNFGKSSRWALRATLGVTTPFTTALEAYALLQPHFAVAAPHTLNMPSFPEEAPMLRVFDLYLASSEDERCFAPYCPVEVVGWLKSDVLRDAPSRLELRNNAVWLALFTDRTAPQIGLRSGRIWSPVLSMASAVSSLQCGQGHQSSRRRFRSEDSISFRRPYQLSRSPRTRTGLSAMARPASFKNVGC